jgi:outer membrane receptor protein involved in Fe transport
LLADKPGARSWVLNAAARETRYEQTELERTSGALSSTNDVTSWKFQSIWEPVSWLRVRGSKSQDIRAAGFRELYYQQYLQKGASNGFANNQWIGPGTGATAANRDDTLIILSGSPALTPEIADTTTFGLVFSPGGVADGLLLSIDYYKIDLEDGIIRGGSGPIVNNCFEEYGLTNSLNGANCSLITFAADSGGAPILTDIEQVLAPYYNDLPYTARGLDFSAQYRLELGKGGILDLRLLASRALEQTIVVGATRWEVDLAGMVGGSGFLPDYAPAPDLTASLVVGYSRGPFRVTTQMSYTSKGWIDLVTPFIGPDDALYDPALANTIIDNVVPSRVTQSVNVAYDFDRGDRNTQLWMSINNLWDRDPPFSTGVTGGTNGGYYDTLGRAYRLGVRFNF